MISFRPVRLALVLGCLCGGVSSTTLVAQDSVNFPTLGEVVSLDPAFDELIDPNTKLQVITSGYTWTEGPVWVSEENGPGYLLFSEIPKNSILKWVEGEGASLFMKPSGFTGVGEYGYEPGSNGLLLDSEGRLVCCEHGDRRISYLTKDGGKRTLCDNYQGKRFNSPNDGVLKSNGDIYFTDPPYGLPKQLDDERAELDFCGVYRVTKDGAVTLITKEITRPNGIGFSPDEKTMYVAQSDPQAARIFAFDVKEDGSVGKGRVFFDASEFVKEGYPGLPDGLDVDHAGNVFATAPGGVLVLNKDGKLLGRVITKEATGNCTFGGPDKSILYLTADTYICRIQTKTHK